MTREDEIVAVVPMAGPAITSRDAAMLTGIPLDTAQKTMHRLLLKRRVRRVMPLTHPARYLRNPDPQPEAYVPVTTVQRAIQSVPKSVWDLGGQGAAP